MDGGMTARRLGMLATIAVMAASGSYVFVYLYRWEWNRALISAAILVAADVALFAAILLARFARLDRRVEGLVGPQPPTNDRVRRRLQENTPAPTKPFAWLNRSQINGVASRRRGEGDASSSAASRTSPASACAATCGRSTISTWCQPSRACTSARPTGSVGAVGARYVAAR
jgi:cell division septation protein DedD